MEGEKEKRVGEGGKSGNRDKVVGDGGALSEEGNKGLKKGKRESHV